MIPKKIFTIWLNKNPELPEIVKKCIDSQKAIGYEHHLITLENITEYSEIDRYLSECLNAENWVKASDFLRMKVLYTYGGIYLDADMDILKPLDDLLNDDMFIGEEKNGVYSNAVVGSIPEHPLIFEYLRRITFNFQGGGDLVFEPGVRAFADLVWLKLWNVKVYPPEYFFPYDHETKQTNITINTRIYHYFLKSWK